MPKTPKLRSRPLETPLHIVLVEPEIPPNTGAIARTAAATQSALHLVGKLGFSIDEHAVRRAGLDYWPLVDLHTHDHFDSFMAGQPDPSRFFFLCSGATRSIYDVDFEPGDALILGKESVGLPESLLARFPQSQHIGIPTLGKVRSLNLATAASVAVFEALRRVGAFEKTFVTDDAIGDS